MPSTRFIWPALVLVTFLFWAIPLFQPNVTIHWDLTDVTYPTQKYFADSVHAGRLPYWTPFLYSGMPFLSDPQTGAWYPLHWPFFVVGITPRSLFWELGLHSFLALAGAFLLARKLFGDPVAAAIAAMFYAWGGFFAAHSSQLGMFEAATLLPWLLWASRLERRSWLLTGIIAGLIILAGNFDTALYCFLALAFFMIASRCWKQAGMLAVATPVIGFCLSAVVLLPWLEIAKYAAHHVTSPAASLRPIHLAAVMSADYFGLISGNYRGPEEIRQFYLYGGLLLLPLAIAGLMRKLQMASILALIVPGLWYAFGPAAGFARVLHMLPAFRDAHAPIEIWFVPALGFALAAGSGAAWAAEKMGQKRLPFILMVIIAADLWHFNMYKSPLVYASSITFEDLYAKRQENFEARIREVKQQPLYRLWMSNPSIAIGPLDGPLIARTEVSWGAGLLELNRYAEYARAVASNPRLLHGLSANYLVDPRGRLEVNPSALPRVSVPPRITSGAYAELAALDPSQGSVVEGLTRNVIQQQPSELTVTGYREDFYQIRYSAPAEMLIRIAVPYAPGWTASVDGAPTAVLPVDYALSGVMVPAGQHQLMLQFRPEHFLLGAGLSIAAAIGIGVLFLV
ncbi:MAG: YfhO family protein [Acidobacteriia bacterium]|nr:YfhO family protein [Terriglobia bacterium]